MLSALAVFGLVWLFFKSYPPTKDYGADLPAAVVVVPFLISWLANMAIVTMGLPPMLYIATMLIYLVVPYALLKITFKLSTRHALIGSAVVFAAVIVVTIAAQMVYGRIG
ncbi:MAG: hypothetical protein AAF270_02720 [Pseudomonadota bacterium]